MFRPFRVNLAGLSSLAKQGRALDSPVSNSKPHRNRASSFALTMRRGSALRRAAAAVTSLTKLSRAKVRARFDERFAIERVAEDYIRLSCTVRCPACDPAYSGRTAAARAYFPDTRDCLCDAIPCFRLPLYCCELEPEGAAERRRRHP